MAKLLFRMRHVPDDEAQEVRDLLDQNKIEYYETFAGNWGISMPALWIKDDQQFAEARFLLDNYQSERSLRIKAEYNEKRSLGETKSMWDSFLEDPFRFIAYIAMIGIVLYLSLQFFLSFD